MRRNFSKEEILFIKENYKKMEYKELAKHLNRTVSSIQSKCLKLGLSRVLWEEIEVQYLMDNYSSKTAKEISKYLGRSEQAIHHKANRMGLVRRGRGRSPRYYLYDGYLICSEYNNRYFIHRKVMEDFLGRKLLSEEIVHHVDGDKLNNNIGNLELHTRESHMLEHIEDRERDCLGKFL